MKKIDELFDELSKSTFRSNFHLHEPEIKYVSDKGIDKIREHAYDFVKKRLSHANIPNDGKQTPMKGHPVFVAQHATATCCRGCLHKWHGIEEKRKLTKEEIDYIVDVIIEWIKRDMKNKWKILFFN